MEVPGTPSELPLLSGGQSPGCVFLLGRITANVMFSLQILIAMPRNALENTEYVICGSVGFSTRCSAAALQRSGAAAQRSCSTAALQRSGVAAQRRCSAVGCRGKLGSGMQLRARAVALWANQTTVADHLEMQQIRFPPCQQKRTVLGSALLPLQCRFRGQHGGGWWKCSV